MKKILSGLLFIILLPFLANSQCNNSLIDLCLKDNEGAKKLKEYPVKLKKVKKKDPSPYAIFNVTLKKGTHYRFNIKNDSLNNTDAKLVLSDDYKLYGTTFDKVNNVNNNYFDFYCKNTGKYYMTVQFMDNKGGCAVGMISYVDNFNVYSSK